MIDNLNILRNNIVQQDLWIEDFTNQLNANSSESAVERALDKDVGVIPKIIEVQKITKKALFVGATNYEINYALMRHKNLRSWITKNFGG